MLENGLLICTSCVLFQANASRKVSDGILHECYFEVLGFCTKLCKLNLYREPPAGLILSSVFYYHSCYQCWKMDCGFGPHVYCSKQMQVEKSRMEFFMNVTLSLLGFSTKLCKLNLYRVPLAGLSLSSFFTIIAATNVGKWIADLDSRDWTMLQYWWSWQDCYLTEWPMGAGMWRIFIDCTWVLSDERWYKGSKTIDLLAGVRVLEWWSGVIRELNMLPLQQQQQFWFWGFLMLHTM